MFSFSDRSALGLALVVVATTALHLAMPLPSDVSWLLVVNERLLEGERLYVDLLETNPPMAVWLYRLPVLLERLTGLRAENWVVLETVVAGLAALTLSAAIARERTPNLPIAVAAAVLLLLPVDSFAQREHFVLFALLPWLALATRRYAGDDAPGWAKLAAGTGIALALAIKPHFALVVVIGAAAVAWRRRSWRPLFAAENWIAVLLLAPYLLAIILAYPSFLTELMPAVSATYLPLRMDALTLVTQFHALLVILVLLAAFAYRRELAGLEVAIAVIAGCLLVYLLQGKGWSYHLLPGTTLAILAFLSMTLARPPAALRTAVPALFGVIVALPAIGNAVVALARPEPLLALIRYGEGRTLLLISSDIGLANPVSRQLRARLIGSSPMLWRATGAIQLGPKVEGEQLARLEAYEQDDYRMLARDLAQQPDLVLVDTMGFDWLAWAKRDAEVAAALSAYMVDETIATHGTMVTVLRRGD